MLNQQLGFSGCLCLNLIENKDGEISVDSDPNISEIHNWRFESNLLIPLSGGHTHANISEIGNNRRTGRIGDSIKMQLVEL